MTTSLRQRKLEITQSVIIEAARTLFAEGGYDDTSMEDIAAAAGCSRRTPYNHFINKRNLWFAIVEEDTEKLYARMVEAAEAASDPLDAYRALSKAAFDSIVESPEADWDFREFQSRAGGIEGALSHRYEFAKRCAAVNDRITELARGAIAAARAEGTIRATEPDVELLLLTVGLLRGASSLAQLSPDDAEREAIFERGWRHALRILDVASG